MSDAKPLLMLAIMVKDEEATIEKTLLSAKPYVDRFVVLDTGSTDRTKEIVLSTMKGVDGEVVDSAFVDFATSRNVLLDRCGERAEFILWLDADDELVGGEALRAFVEKHRDLRGPAHEAYYVRVDVGFTMDSARILRSQAGWRFKGAVHEVVCRADRDPPSIRIPDVTIRHRSTGVSAERSRKRWERDLVLLERALSLDPKDARSAFYFAQTNHWLGRQDEAARAFERRIALGGWYEEVYESQFRLAGIREQQGAPWPEVMELYLAAHATAPKRAEPLHAIAAHYNSIGERALCFLFARRGFEMPRPSTERLWIDDSVYAWKLADLVASTAYWLGEFPIGEVAARQAVDRGPDDPRFRKNLDFYLERKQKR